MQYLYVMFSSTPYKMGKFIRTVTRSPYNHMSISLDPELKELYTFARRYDRTPFYGGFVRETPGRYYRKGEPAQVCLCRLPLTEAQYRDLKNHLEQMYCQRDRYLYNYFSVLAVPLQRRIRVHNAYVCVEFCMDVLSRAGLEVDLRKYYSIKKAVRLMEPWCFYVGSIPSGFVPDPSYYAKRPLRHPYYTSVRSMLALFPRLRQKA